MLAFWFRAADVTPQRDCIRVCDACAQMRVARMRSMRLFFTPYFGFRESDSRKIRARPQSSSGKKSRPKKDDSSVEILHICKCLYEFRVSANTFHNYLIAVVCRMLRENCGILHEWIYKMNYSRNFCRAALVKKVQQPCMIAVPKKLGRSV